MALLRKDISEGTSYLELAEFLHKRGAKDHVSSDLEQLNPNVDKAEHVLNLDETDNRPSLTTVIDTAEWYQLTKDRGTRIVEEVLQQTRQWRTAAAIAGIARADIELTASAFALSA